MSAARNASLAVPRSDLEGFFVGIRAATEEMALRTRDRERTEANRFNVFNLIDPDENKLSSILADLLDPRGSHGQGDVFLRLFFGQLGLDMDAELTAGATVRREAPTYSIARSLRRMDVLVDAGVLVAIEHKVDSPEQAEQVKDYLEHLQACARQRGNRSVLVYLTPDGRRPVSTAGLSAKGLPGCGLECWSHRDDLTKWLRTCRERCEARKIQDFLSDFLAHVRTALIAREFDARRKGT